MSVASKPSTTSSNVIVNVISPFVVELASSVIVTVGAVVSSTSVCVPAELTFNAASVAVTDTELSPSFTESVPETMLAVSVSILQVPSVATTEYVAPAITAVMVEPTSAVPETTGVVSVVRDALDITGTPDAVVSTTTSCTIASALLLPAASVAVAEMR